MEEKITIVIPKHDAIVLQHFWGSWFGNGKTDVCLGDLQKALDTLQHELWNKLGKTQP